MTLASADVIGLFLLSIQPLLQLLLTRPSPGSLAHPPSDPSTYHPPLIQHPPVRASVRPHQSSRLLSPTHPFHPSPVSTLSLTSSVCPLLPSFIRTSTRPHPAVILVSVRSARCVPGAAPGTRVAERSDTWPSHARSGGRQKSQARSPRAFPATRFHSLRSSRPGCSWSLGCGLRPELLAPRPLIHVAQAAASWPGPCSCFPGRPSRGRPRARRGPHPLFSRPRFARFLCTHFSSLLFLSK